MKRYESIHGDKFKANQADEFQMMQKPDNDMDQRALAQEDYQTRLRVERANLHKK
jgi:hypothetical protein